MDFKKNYLTKQLIPIKIIVICIYLLIGNNPTTHAVTKTWIATGADSSWFTGANWNPAGVPASGDNVIIAATYSSNPTKPCMVISSSNANCNDLTIDAGASLYAWNSASITGYLLIYGSLTVNGTMSSFRSPSSTNLTLYFNPVLVGGTSGAYKTITCGASSNLSKAELQISFNSTGAYYQLGSNIKLHGFLMNYGGFKMNGYNMTIWQFLNGSTYSNTGTFYLGAGTLKICGTSAHAVFVDLTSGYWDSSGGGTVVYDATGSEWSGTFYSQFAAGNYNYTGNQTVKSVSYNSLQVNTICGNTVTLGSTADLTVGGNLTLYNPSTAGGIVTTAYNITLNGNLVIGNAGNGLTFNIGHRITRSSASGSGALTMDNNDNIALNITYSHATNRAIALGASAANTTLLFYGSVTYNSNAAQLIMDNTYKNLTISGNGTRSLTAATTIDGNLTLSGGTLDVVSGSNYGITIKGDWTNNGATFNACSGTVTFSGTQNQNIKTNGSVFYNATVTNATATALTLQSNTTAKGTLTLSGGNISTGNYIMEIGTDAANRGTLSRTSGTIVGNCKRWFTTATNSGTTGLFPIGTATVYRPVQVDFTSAPTSSGNLVACFKESAVGTNGLPYNDGGQVVDLIWGIGYWQIDATTLSGGQYTISLWDNSGTTPTDHTKLRVSKRTDASSAWGAVGTHGTTASSPISVSRTGVSGFSHFAIGRKLSENPLPVELAYFKILCNTGTIDLIWQTYSEHNNDYFIVERTKDLENWQTLSIVAGAGTSNITLNYAITDNEPWQETTFYRLKQTDVNGHEILYHPVKNECINGKCVATDIQVIIKNNQLELCSDKCFGDLPVTVELINTMGTVLSSGVFAGSSQLLNLPVCNLSLGVYLVRINDGQKQFVKKVFIN